ncbi:MAG: hypothetical protein K2Y22_14780 [Candidatus Obscuribacterales bacterium]|nr:hypothetical protein [Candidatus Obscuribacterales bacterium]
MSNQTFKRLFFLVAAAAAVVVFVMFTSGCNIQPPSTEQPKEDAPTMVGLYTSPYDLLVNDSADCNDFLMTFKGDSYIASNDSQKVSSYMSPCQLSFMINQSKETRALVADLTSSATKEDTRLTANLMTYEDAQGFIQLRNEKMNIDVFLRSKASEMLPRSKDFDGSYDRSKLTTPVPDFVDQLAQKLIAAGYKFSSAKPGQLQFDSGSLEATSGYNTAAIMFEPGTK